MVFHIRHPLLLLLALANILMLLDTAVIAQEEIEEIDKEHAILDREQTIVDNSYTFFCDRIIDNEEDLSGVTIIFNGKTATAYSRVIHIANCAGDIDLVRDEIPNEEYLHRLQDHYDRLPPKFIKVSNTGKRTRKFVLFPQKKIICNLYIFRPIQYKNTYYILYYILFDRDYKIFYGISLDDDYNVIDYCTKSYPF